LPSSSNIYVLFQLTKKLFYSFNFS